MKDNAKQMMLNSRVELNNPMFNELLIKKVLQLEERKARFRRILSLGVLAAGILLLAVSCSLFAQHLSLGRVEVLSAASNAVSGFFQMSSKWVFIYLRILEIAAALLVFKIIIEWQMDLA